MSRLYHYTSVSGLRGIVDSGNIRATHLGFLNDLSEGGAARKDEAWRAQLEAAEKRAPLFIASFCRHQEPHQLKNGLLSQWRGYAGEGGGYCVVFDEAVLDGLVEAERRISPGLTILKKDVLYAGEGEEEVPGQNMDFLDLAAFVKSEAFREENETRIVLAVPPDDSRAIRFRDASEMLIPYVEVFSGRRLLPITEVIVGPSPLQRRCAAGVVQFLRTHGLNVAVRLSEIPLAR
ncbi:DUF2971 domain-containing protein [Aestuariivirga sp.]|uniref:DUF2971 domain-containing protein n=1 Tax=Aestuariivirga sp. TaxID=2650926 RepID=UPI003BAD04A4